MQGALYPVILIAGCLLALLGDPLTAQGAPLPRDPPRNLVWEGAPALGTAVKWKLESLLLQHQHLTGERILLVLAPKAAEPGLAELARLPAPRAAKEIFDHWNLETTARANQLLIYLREGHSGIQPGIHIGTGISLDAEHRNSLTQALEEALRRHWADLPDDTVPWDSLALLASREVLLSLQSPVLEQLEDARTLDGAIPRPDRSAPISSGSPWRWVLFILAVSGTLFYWTYERILEQAVLIGSKRWVLFGPRLKLQLLLRQAPAPLRLAGTRSAPPSGSPSFIGGGNG